MPPQVRDQDFEPDQAEDARDHPLQLSGEEALGLSLARHPDPSQCQAEIPAGGDRNDVRQAGRNERLGLDVAAPGNDRAVALQGEAVVGPGGDRNDTRQSGRNAAALEQPVIAPTDDRAIALEGEAEVQSGRDGHDAQNVGRNFGLPERVVSPNGDRAVALQRKAVMPARRDSPDTP